MQIKCIKIKKSLL